MVELCKRDFNSEGGGTRADYTSEQEQQRLERDVTRTELKRQNSLTLHVLKQCAHGPLEVHLNGLSLLLLLCVPQNCRKIVFFKTFILPW